MSNIADKLQTLQNIKTDIKTSILNKGVDVNDDFTTYANAINSIETGGGETITLTDIEITTNGQYTSPDGEGYKTVNVNVPTGENVDNCIYPYLSPEQLEDVYNDDGHFQDGLLFIDNVDGFLITHKYEGLLAESPNNGEPLVENYYYNGGFEWKYVTDVNENNYLTPLNSVIEPYLSSYNIEKENGGQPISEIYNTIVREYPNEVFLKDIQGNDITRIYYSNDRYVISTDDIRDLVSGERIRYFRPLIVPSQVIGLGYYFNDFYETYKGKIFDSIYVYDAVDYVDIARCENNPIVCRYWYKKPVNEDTIYSIYCAEAYPTVVAPELEFGDLYINGTFYLTNPIIKKVKMGNVSGNVRFSDNFLIEEISIKSLKFTYNSYMFYNCKNLKKLNNIYMGECKSIGFGFLGYCYNLSDIGGFQDLGKSFVTNMDKSLYINTTNLPKQSILNIFNTIYDLTLNGMTGNLHMGHLNIDKVTEEDIAIATKKGWVVQQ